MSKDNNNEDYKERFDEQKPKQSKRRKIFHDKVNYLRKRGEDFKLEVTNRNYRLTSKKWNDHTYSKGAYNTKELHFIKKVRRYVINNEIYLEERFQDQVVRQQIDYINVAPVPDNSVFDNVIEIDLDQAYWETAKELGIIDDEIYNIGKKGNISKQARLSALGSLAKKSKIIEFKDGVMQPTEVKREPLLENIWYHICKRISDVMNEAAKYLGKDFIFYWVDGIYMINTPENIEKIKAVFQAHGYNSKVRKIHTIIFNETGFVCCDEKSDLEEFEKPAKERKKRKGLREFNYPYYRKQKKASYTERKALQKFANDIMFKNVDLVDQIAQKYKR